MAYSPHKEETPAVENCNCKVQSTDIPHQRDVRRHCCDQGLNVLCRCVLWTATPPSLRLDRKSVTTGYTGQHHHTHPGKQRNGGKYKRGIGWLSRCLNRVTLRATFSNNSLTQWILLCKVYLAWKNGIQVAETEDKEPRRCFLLFKLLCNGSTDSWEEKIPSSTVPNHLQTGMILLPWLWRSTKYSVCLYVHRKC